ncbi:Leucine-rich repeat-containing protein [Artemisia annua]|uniref:Leucine-rich repeat-containing protein n=1 Tax=Artemisia annua TaxID=35608 RepID=A0A2U1Q1H4_ARTAN|nr:Leucine-rich repeat-containing protein [Artemisia annua]
MFSGEIPSSMSEMTLLNNLDISFNDLSGSIPLGTQLQTFDSSRYTGNAGLCGRPLHQKCSGDEDLEVPPVGESDGDGESTNELQNCFYIGGACGFATGFWIVCSSLLLNRRGRQAFFQFHDSLKDWVYVNTVVFIAKVQRAALLLSIKPELNPYLKNIGLHHHSHHQIYTKKGKRHQIDTQYTVRNKIYIYSMSTHVLFILLLFLLWLNTTTATSHGHQLVAAAGQAVHKCIAKERQALLDIKAQLQDPYGQLSTWKDEEDCCKWDRVLCNSSLGHVIMLDLSNGGGLVVTILFMETFPSSLYTGTIPEFIGNMTQLSHLDLAHNQFTGTIPKSIGNMNQLTHLYLGQNQFTGTIPEFISNMTQLTHLYLDQNQFTGTIPESIGNMNQLIYLCLDGNNFSGVIPRSIGSLTKLEVLDLSDTSFYGTIPTEFGNLTNLVFLYLYSLRGCTVENLDWLSSLSSLTALYMDGTSLAKANNWVNVIIGLQNLEELSLVGCDLSKVMHPYSSSVNSSLSLYRLNLDNNNLNSSMYRWLCPLIGNLTHLSLSGNKFGEISDFLNILSGCTSATTLNTLDASSNQFTGSLSDEIQHFSSLNSLNLSYNQLDGTISEKMWQLPNLQWLYLSSNSFSGAISENIGNVAYIDLSNNSLKGALSNDDTSNLFLNVDYLDVSFNNLGPRFPKWIQKLTNLAYLDLSNNNISDTIPNDNCNQWRSSQLNYLDLSFNNISGTVPESLLSFNLGKLDLSFNSFYGPIPAFPASISFLDLSRNKFHGGISFLCQMYKKLEFLDLSRNTLSGQLPDCFQNLTYLKVLNLGQNTLSGSIPPSVGCLGQLETLSLYNNNFSGGLPTSLKNCTQLSILDLGDNSLYGDIPVWIGKKLSRLYALSLKSNNFFGTIPSQICQLVSLQILDLSDNKLYGTIPSCVNSLTSMVQKGSFLEQNVHHYLSSFSLRITSNSSIGGKVNEFSSNLGLLKVIDLSSNNLTGEIPNEVTNLHGLLVLDLSNNSLVGEIPRDIGQMTQLLTFNLSRNMFSGEIPSSMSEMTLLNNLDISFNDLSGSIPLGTQLQTFDSSRYTGNAGLCGRPLHQKCSGDEDLEVPPVGESDGDGESTNELQNCFYIGGACGFATGFWIVCSSLLLNRRGRQAFFQFHDSLKDWVYVNTVVFIAKVQRAARA